jgi:hypothetical protein
MTIEVLLDERDIQRQLIKLARAMDDRDWQALQSILAEDIAADFGTGEVRGSAAVSELIRSYLDNCGTTQHLLGNIFIDVEGTRATSESYVSDMHLSKNEALDTRFRTLGNYSDTWVKVDGVWLLSKRVKNNRAVIGSMDVFEP